ncbi:MAG: hypothetical protein GX444_13625 [Myxococcales bacterium]|nr:hypothetical protein [Myxococcales bacterium]
MKRLFVIAMLLAVLTAGCAYYQKEALPHGLYNASQMEAKNLAKGDYFVKTRYGFRLITIPISMPEPNEMIDTTISEHQAKGVTNVEVEFSEFNILLFQIPKMRITGYVVK